MCHCFFKAQHTIRYGITKLNKLLPGFSGTYQGTGYSGWGRREASRTLNNCIETFILAVGAKELREANPQLVKDPVHLNFTEILFPAQNPAIIATFHF